MAGPTIEPGRFVVRRDAFSAQVSYEGDGRFWFRLERSEGEDRITDFFPGRFDPARSGEVLALCYRALGTAPQGRIVFLDIASRAEPGARLTAAAEMLDHARDFMQRVGRLVRSAQLRQRDGKVDAVVEG